ncbi:MAG: efflux RND transporter periplasmic adaptor subunit, partial [candidate division Zixibacteria bacterium]|nr:efflux RND transporter periplasmic adaptor subunit [candidate division Zixibacteria bacterium]
MKKYIFAVILISAALGAVYLFLAPGSTVVAKNNNNPVKRQYTCGMHPEIISDEPGYCPICGMKLTLKKDGTNSSVSVTIDPVTTRNMGLKTVPVDYLTLSRSVNAFGKVSYREPNLYTVNLKVNGWVEKLYVAFKGERVSKSQPLLEIYSPELMAAQKEYLIAYKASLNDTEAAGNMRSLLEAVRQRLLNWDISDDQLKRLEETGDISRTLSISSPAEGVVVDKKVSEGEYLKAGAELYRLADLSSVWVIASIYEQDLPWVSLGQKATIALPNLPGEKFKATVSYISPYLDERRLAEVRLELSNPRALLKPEMYAEVTLHSTLSGDRLAVPRAAVIHSGVRELVYVVSGEGAYEPRLITSGAVGEDDMVEVLSG